MHAPTGFVWKCKNKNKKHTNTYLPTLKRIFFYSFTKNFYLKVMKRFVFTGK